MRISSAFPGQYLKAADLQGQEVIVSMDKVKMEDLGGEHKAVLYFIGKERGLVLNKTNSNNIAFLYGDETDEWHGKKIVLFETNVDFQGKTVPAIRVKGPIKIPSFQKMQKEDPISSGPIAPAVPRRVVGGTSDTQLNDDIPF